LLDGIAKELIFGYVAHEAPCSGDKGIQFALRTTEAEQFKPERYEEWVHD